MEICRPCIPWFVDGDFSLPAAEIQFALIKEIHLHLRRQLAPALPWLIRIAPNPEPDLTHVHDVRVPEK